MAKKSLLDVAAAGTSVFDQLASGNTINTQNIIDAQNTKNAENKKDAKNTDNKKDTNKPVGRPREYGERGRFNLLLPPDLRDYLILAAARESVTTKKRVSPTGYITKLIKEDMEKNKGEQQHG